MRKLLVLVIIGLAPLALTQDASNSRAAAVKFLREINTAQASTKSRTGRFAEWESLAKNVKSALPLGCEFRLLVSPDGAKYEARVVAKEPCGVSFFTNESGLIDHGANIGCKIQVESTKASN